MNKFLLGLVILVSCASGPEVKRVYDYVITDMSSDSRPDWIDSEYIVELNAKNDGYKYYIGENDIQASRVTKALCTAASETKARFDFAAAIESTIKSVYRETESVSQGESTVVRSDANLDRSLNIDKALGGAEKFKAYWEQRSHTKEKGAKEDYTSFYCATLVRMKKDGFDSVITSAVNKMVDDMKKPAVAAAAVNGLKTELTTNATNTDLPAPVVTDNNQ